MPVAADRVRSAAIAAAREDAAVVLDARIDLFGYGGVFGEVLGEMAAAGCEQARRWVTNTAEELFWLSSSLTLAGERSADGEMEQWPLGPEVILDELEALQEIWAGIKDENREMCNRPADVVVRDSRIGEDSGPGTQTDTISSGLPPPGGPVVVYHVRDAARADDGTDDPPLTLTGQIRVAVPAVYDPRQLTRLAAKIWTTPGTHLVAGDCNTTPMLVAALGGDPYGPIRRAAYESDRRYA